MLLLPHPPARPLHPLALGAAQSCSSAGGRSWHEGARKGVASGLRPRIGQRALRAPPRELGPKALPPTNRPLAWWEAEGGRRVTRLFDRTATGRRSLWGRWRRCLQTAQRRSHEATAPSSVGGSAMRRVWV